MNLGNRNGRFSGAPISRHRDCASSAHADRHSWLITRRSIPSGSPRLFAALIACAALAGCLTDAVPPASVKGLLAESDSSGIIHLRWNKSRSSRVQAYLIYRDTLGSILPSEEPYGSTADTTFADTIYATDIPTPEGRHYYLDTIVHAYTYRVRILDSSDNIGTLHGSVQGVPIPPTRNRYISGRWHKASGNNPFGWRKAPKVVVFNNALWLFGGQGPGAQYPSKNINANGYWTDLWTSNDGVQWQKVLDSIPFSGQINRRTAGDGGMILATAYNGKLWMILNINQRSALLNTSDGTNWSVVRDSLPMQEFPYYFGTFRNALIVSSRNLDLFMSSANGNDWTNIAQSSPLPNAARTVVGGYTSAITTFDEKIWLVGGAAYSNSIFNSSDGGAWSLVYDREDDFLSRNSHSIAAHDGKLWSVGGRHYWKALANTVYSICVVNVGCTSHPPPTESQIWNSVDGKSWNLVDLNPFPPRDQPAVASFNGRLWVIGGAQPDGTNDIWYYE